jgi:hypothetical protein
MCNHGIGNKTWPQWRSIGSNVAAHHQLWRQSLNVITIHSQVTIAPMAIAIGQLNISMVIWHDPESPTKSDGASIQLLTLSYTS